MQKRSKTTPKLTQNVAKRRGDGRPLALRGGRGQLGRGQQGGAAAHAPLGRRGERGQGAQPALGCRGRPEPHGAGPL